MAETNKSRNDQVGNNKMVIKIGGGGGGGGGGGIGAVVLLGGALATAAFASAFVLVGHKRRSSEKENSSPEKDDERKGEKEEVEMEKDSTIMIFAHSFNEDDGKPGDTEKMDSDDGFVIVKEEIPLLAEKEEKGKAELTKEDVSNDFSKESPNLDIEDDGAERKSDGDGDGETNEMHKPREEENNQLCQDQEDDIEAIRAENGVEGFQIDQTNDDKNLNIEKREFCNGNGEINGEKFLESEAIDKAKVDLNDDGIAVSESHNIDGDELLLPTAAVEMVPVKESINGSIVNQSTKQNGAHEEIGERLEVDAKIEGLDGENEEDPGLGLNENRPALLQHPDSETQGHKDDVKKEIENDNGSKATMSNMVNGEVSEGVEVMKKTRVVISDDGVDRSKDLKEGLWQETQQVKVMSYEVGGKIEEDMAVMKKYEVEMGMVKDHRMTNTTGRRMIVWILCVVSSLSCSWFFDLSCAKMCLVVFLTVFLLEIYGYPLMNHQPDRCLHAVKGEGGYAQRS